MTGISAEVSVYPLRQASLSPAIDETLRVFRAHGLLVEPGAMSTLIAGDDEAIFRALEQAFRTVAESGHVVMHVTLSNACPVVSSGSRPAAIPESIGHIEKDFEDRAKTTTPLGSTARDAPTPSP